MGGAVTTNQTLRNTIDTTVMENIYSMTNSCILDQSQKQSLIINATGDVVLQGISQKQKSTADLSCLADNKLAQLFTQDLKNSLQQSLKASVSGVGTGGMSANTLSENMANALYSKNNITSIQEAISKITQTQSVILNIDNITLNEQISQEQVADAIMQQISNVSSDVVTQTEKETAVKVSTEQTVVGADVTQISTTAIKTVGSVLKTFANTMLIGALLVGFLLIAAVIGLIIFVKMNCPNIKKGIDNAYKQVPIPMIQLKALSLILGMICPSDNPEQSKKKSVLRFKKK